MLFLCLIDSFNKSIRKNLKGRLNYSSKEIAEEREEDGRDPTGGNLELDVDKPTTCARWNSYKIK